MRSLKQSIPRWGSTQTSIFGISTWLKRTENQNKIYLRWTGRIFFQNLDLLTCSHWTQRKQINYGRWVAKNGLTINWKKKKAKIILQTAIIIRLLLLAKTTRRINITARRTPIKAPIFSLKVPLWHATLSLFLQFKKLKNQRKKWVLDAQGYALSRTPRKLKPNEEKE